jgi:hypothetical protein
LSACQEAFRELYFSIREMQGKMKFDDPFFKSWLVMKRESDFG